LYPVSIRITLNPGDVYPGSITVINPNDFPLRIKTEKENLAGGAEGSVELIGDKDIPYGLSAWVKFANDEVTLQPQERRQFDFVITIPKNAQPGGHYAALLFRGLTSTSTVGSGAGISGRVGTILLVEISGDVKRSGEITEITAPKFIDRGPLALSFKVSNSGNSYFSPEGTVEFRNLLWTHKSAWDSRVVFPGFDRTFKATWDQKYFVGPVFATLKVQIPNGPILSSNPIVIWAFPWQEFLVSLGGFAVLLVALKFLKKNFRIVRVGRTSPPSTDGSNET
jgi:hypothetical protein